MGTRISPRRFYQDPLSIHWFEADAILQGLWKPWEYGGHLHDFRTATRSQRVHDIAPYIEEDPVLKKKNELLLKENEGWGKMRELKIQMLDTLAKLQATQKQRLRCAETRRSNSKPRRPKPPPPCRKSSHAKLSPHYMTPIVPCSKAMRTPRTRLIEVTSAVSLGVGNKDNEHLGAPCLAPRSPSRKEVLELDAFDLRLETIAKKSKEKSSRQGKAPSEAKKKK